MRSSATLSKQGSELDHVLLAIPGRANVCRLVVDFKSKKLDLEKSETFRDLSKPIGAVNPERIQYLR